MLTPNLPEYLYHEACDDVGIQNLVLQSLSPKALWVHSAGRLSSCSGQQPSPRAAMEKLKVVVEEPCRRSWVASAGREVT